MEYFPARQLLHAASPDAVLYFPAAHAVHAPPSGPVDPALQAQAVASLLAAGASERVGHHWHTSETAPTAVEYCPATQLLHAAGPDAILYVPATHTVHVPPWTPAKPALQIQSIASLLASGAYEFDGHP